MEFDDYYEDTFDNYKYDNSRKDHLKLFIRRLIIESAVIVSLLGVVFLFYGLYLKCYCTESVNAIIYDAHMGTFEDSDSWYATYIFNYDGNYYKKVISYSTKLKDNYNIGDVTELMINPTNPEQSYLADDIPSHIYTGIGLIVFSILMAIIMWVYAKFKNHI
ncbi:MAG: hypothetical protein K5662_03195 [Lachnospiraceae bacterium]|nr:hypothetical protein [Lachnospiraceae bacterium]